MKRKLLSAILALCMVFCLLPTFALAGDGTTSTPVYPAGITADDFASANAFYLNGLNESVSGAAVAVFINGSGNLEYVADIRTAAIMGATEIWCLENADMRARATDTNRTEPLTADLTIHGNGANFNGGQINISASSNEGDVTLVIENAKNLSVWGNPGSTGRTYHVTMRNCAVEKDSGEGLVMWRGSSSNTDKIDLLVEDCYLKSTGSTPMDGIHTTAGGSVTVRNSTFEGNANAINLSNKTDDAMTLVVENTAFDGCGLENSTTNADLNYRAPIRVVSTGKGITHATVTKSTFSNTVGSNGDILLGDGREGKTSNDVSVTVSGTAATIQSQKPGYFKNDNTTDETQKAEQTIAATDNSYTTSSKMLFDGPTGDDLINVILPLIPSLSPSETIVPALNTADHTAYVAGYPNGTVSPSGSITRAETAAILFRLMTKESRKEFYATSNRFYDVSDSAWYNTYVSTLARAGVIVDSSNGYFRPDDAITRAELASMLAQFAGGTAGASRFSDVSSTHWASTAIARISYLGWIKGYPDGTFRPDQSITRAEMMAMMNRALGRAPETASDILPGAQGWKDNQDTSSWYYLDVLEATNSHDFIRRDAYETWTGLLANPDWSQYE